ncbi:MAG: hypothetical protein N3G20_06885, partial [Verrucomicrobiae bacterium]|nr:hypothetical protein [Verrucomicrobiae bacterium]
MKYVQNGSAVTVPLSPTRIFVLPSPNLHIHYFHQRDVVSDDPCTDVIEPAVPYNLAVLVQNRGYGRARNFRITSAQPQIVENEKGLLIDFCVVATEVAGHNIIPSLTADFGDINPGQTVIGRWLMTSPLQGLFIDYKASFGHIDSVGKPQLSLIDELVIHEMIQLVQATGVFEDGKPDFLVHDDQNPFARPDTIYLSDGTSRPVAVLEQATPDRTPIASDVVVHLSVFGPAGWMYVRVPDPANSRFRLARVERADGATISVGTNVWV